VTPYLLFVICVKHAVHESGYQALAYPYPIELIIFC